MKKILLIEPKPLESFWSLKGLCEASGRTKIIPPLGLATLAAITPAYHEVQIVDESVEEIDFDTPCDLVGITGYTIDKDRMFEIAKEFQDRGILTIGGGVFCTSHPEDAEVHFDVVITGEAERVWPEFLRDLEKGDFKSLYQETEKLDLREHPSPLPRWDLVKLDRYMAATIQTSRGCPYDCEFCDVVSLFGNKTRYKSIEQVLEEMQLVVDHGAVEVFFADDNFIGNPRYAKELLKAIIEFNRKRRKPLRFITQVTLNCAESDELLDLFKRANFFSIFIGIETPKPESLVIANKQHNMRRDMKESIEKIQSRGMMIIPGMIVGFDTDDLDIFRIQEEFLKDVGLMFPLMGLLMAPKGTKLWDRMAKENRLTTTEHGDSFLSTNLVPKLMTKVELETNYIKLLKTVYSEKHFRTAFKTYINQVDLDAIKTESAVNQMLDFRKSHFFFTMIGLRILKTYLFSGKKRRKLLVDILKITFQKSVRCIPLGVTALAYFYALNGYMQRHTEAFKIDDITLPEANKKGLQPERVATPA
jgi:radical SAM superfamily enzyme YgiQ (UPF0313 family)